MNEGQKRSLTGNRTNNIDRQQSLLWPKHHNTTNRPRTRHPTRKTTKEKPMKLSTHSSKRRESTVKKQTKVCSTHRVAISVPDAATPIIVLTPHPLWQHSRACRMVWVSPMHSINKLSPFSFLTAAVATLVLQLKLMTGRASCWSNRKMREWAAHLSSNLYVYTSQLHPPTQALHTFRQCVGRQKQVVKKMSTKAANIRRRWRAYQTRSLHHRLSFQLKPELS